MMFSPSIIEPISEQQWPIEMMIEVGTSVWGMASAAVVNTGEFVLHMRVTWHMSMKWGVSDFHECFGWRLAEFVRARFGVKRWRPMQT